MMLRLKSLILPALIVISACILIVAASWNESITFDEVTYIPSGYSYVSRADMRLNPEHPPLFKDMIGLPLLFMDIQEGAFSHSSWNDETNDQWEFGRQFLFTSGNNAETIAHRARLPTLFFFIIAASIIFAWTRSRFGNTAAYIALIVFCFSPTVMAHSGFATNDIASASGALVGLFALAYFLRQPSYARASIAGLGLGFALLTKFSNVLLVPLFLGFALFYTFVLGHWNEEPLIARFKVFLRSIAKIAIIYAIALFICVYPVYAVHVSHYPAEKQRIDTEAITKGFPLASNLVWLSDKAITRPLAHFILGVSMNIVRTGGESKTYFIGEVSDLAPSFYFPFAYLIKEPAPWILLLLVGISVGIFRFFKRVALGKKSDKEPFVLKYRDELLMTAWILSYGGLSMSGNLAIGIRHILPLYPFIIMLTCGIIIWIARIVAQRHKKYGNIFHFALWLLIIWYVIENIVAFPFYLPYFNHFVGGSKNGGEYLNDSNIDWSQELIRVRMWLDEHAVGKIEGDIFTSSDHYYYLGDRFIPLHHKKYNSAEDFIERSETEWIVISESTLREKWAQGGYEWLRTYEPAAVIGYAIRVYQITNQSQ